LVIVLKRLKNGRWLPVIFNPAGAPIEDLIPVTNTPGDQVCHG